eukprot:TRINITY_DN45666_c0_g1_i1.p1 TRINITY_DN45666_c0_g1~~TRINITY_DN45666_c0_g1_i1.p1  ORF type:complete len:308 (-),score=32.29 TRINITY_DN45666_c0_g1_i1:239-1162(-)
MRPPPGPPTVPSSRCHPDPPSSDVPVRRHWAKLPSAPRPVAGSIPTGQSVSTSSAGGCVSTTGSAASNGAVATGAGNSSTRALPSVDGHISQSASSGPSEGPSHARSSLPQLCCGTRGTAEEDVLDAVVVGFPAGLQPSFSIGGGAGSGSAVGLPQRPSSTLAAQGRLPPLCRALNSYEIESARPCSSCDDEVSEASTVASESEEFDVGEQPIVCSAPSVRALWLRGKPSVLPSDCASSAVELQCPGTERQRANSVSNVVPVLPVPPAPRPEPIPPPTVANWHTNAPPLRREWRVADVDCSKGVGPP